MEIDYSKIIVAKLNLNIDYNKITKEILKLVNHKKCVSFSYPPDRNSIDQVTSYSIFLRSNVTQKDYSYRGAKLSKLEEWYWDETIKIPYTKKIINTLPFSSLGTVRVVMFPAVPCVEHTDWDNQLDTMQTLGLSLIPDTANVPCQVYIKNLNKFVDIPGNAMLLNDSTSHKVPAGTRTRICIRLFGLLDYKILLKYVDNNYLYMAE